MFLCSVTSADLQSVYGRASDMPSPPTVDLGLIMVGQAEDFSSYLALATTSHAILKAESSIPDGYTFIFRQAWGLTITKDILDRVVETLRAEAYPPMADYLDGIVKSNDTQVQTYKTACLAVKAKYTKLIW